jgi:hypothetical protein
LLLVIRFKLLVIINIIGPVFTKAANSTPKSPSVTTTSQNFVHQAVAPLSSPSSQKGQIIAGAPRVQIPSNPAMPTNQPQYIVVSSSSPQISGQLQIAQSSGQIVKSASEQTQLVQSVSPMIQGNTSSPHAQVRRVNHCQISSSRVDNQQQPPASAECSSSNSGLADGRPSSVSYVHSTGTGFSRKYYSNGDSKRNSSYPQPDPTSTTSLASGSNNSIIFHLIKMSRQINLSK